MIPRIRVPALIEIVFVMSQMVQLEARASKADFQAIENSENEIVGIVPEYRRMYRDMHCAGNRNLQEEMWDTDSQKSNPRIGNETIDQRLVSKE